MKRSGTLVRLWAVLALTGLALPLSLGVPASLQAQGTTQMTIERTVIYPDLPSVRQAPALRLSADQLEALQARKRQIRARVAAGSNPNPAGPTGRANVLVPQIRTGAVSRAPSDFAIGRSIQNPRGNVLGLSSTLAEPAAANNGRHIFAAGNFDHSEYSLDGGTTWVDVPIPAGPSDAPIACCDNDVVFDNARRVLFHSTLYINNAATNGLVRIFVYRAFNLPANCSYTIDQAGANDTILMDYPHIGRTSNNFFLASNDININGNQVARMRRMSIDAMTDCGPITITTSGWPQNIEGQRVVVPGEGTNDQTNMYWALNDNTTTLRVFRWRDADAVPTNATRTVSTSTFGDPDCRGGTLNNDYIDGIAGGIYGFNLRTAYGRGRVGVYWQVTNDAGHPQAYIRAALFREDPRPGAAPFNPILIGEPDLWNAGFCMGIPQVSANARGDFGFTLGAGGQAGGDGSAAQGYVGIDDDFNSCGMEGNPCTIFLTAAGDTNRTDERYGDYFTIHAWQPCTLWFNATNYALSGGTGVANVNSRYVEFGRQRDRRCYDNWSTRPPVPLP